MTLEDKLAAAETVTRRCLWHPTARHDAAGRMRMGQEQYGEEYAGRPPEVESYDESLDIGNYGAFARLRGEWCWRWWLVVFLAGLQGRLLAKIERRNRAREKRWAQ